MLGHLCKQNCLSALLFNLSVAAGRSESDWIAVLWSRATSELYLRLWGVVGRGVACFISSVSIMIPGITTSVYRSLSFHSKSVDALTFVLHLFTFQGGFAFSSLLQGSLFSLKWRLKQYLAFSNPDLFTFPQSGGRLLGAVSTSSFFSYSNVLPHSLAHTVPPPFSEWNTNPELYLLSAWCFGPIVPL